MHFLVSSHPCILISLGLCVLACILAPFLVSCLYHMPLFACLHPHIRRFVCACSCSGILTSSYLQVHKCWLVYSQPCISYPQIHVCLLVSLHPQILWFICACWYPRILTSSYPQVHVCLLVSSHPPILRLMCVCWYPRILTSSYPQVYVRLLVCSHPQVNVFAIQMGNCILTSSSSLVLGNCASQIN